MNPHWSKTGKTQNEALIMSFLNKHMHKMKLTHKNMIPFIYDVDVDGNVLENQCEYILMEFVEGRTVELEKASEEQKMKFLVWKGREKGEGENKASTHPEKSVGLENTS